jgi:hypothetical protein
MTYTCLPSTVTRHFSSSSSVTDAESWTFQFAPSPHATLASSPVRTPRPRQRNWQRRRTGERVPHWMR